MRTRWLALAVLLPAAVVCLGQEPETDPIEEFVAAAKAEIAEWKSVHQSESGYRDELAKRVESLEELRDRWSREQRRLEEILERGGAFSTKAAQVLLRTRRRVERAQHNLEGRRQPDLDEEFEQVQSSLVEVGEQLLELEVPAEENEELQRLLAAAGPRAKKAQREFDDKKKERTKVLEGRRATLLVTESHLRQLADVYATWRHDLQTLSTFVLGKMYWIRDGTSLGQETLAGAGDDLGQLWRTLTGPDVARSLRSLRDTGPTLFYAMVALFVLLVAGAAALSSLLRRRTRRWAYRGGTTLVLLQRIGAALLLSAAAPALLLVASFMMRNLDLPETFHGIVTVLLVGYAIVLFASRFLWVLFRPQGIAETELRISPRICLQMLRASRRASYAALLLYLPWLALRRELEQVHLPRLLYTLLLIAIAVTVGRLVRRKGALVTELTAKTGFWYRAWFIVGPVVRIGLVGLVVMDVLGYRIGAAMLTTNVLLTLAAALVLAGVYRLFTEVSERAAYAIGFRHTAREGEEDITLIPQQIFEQLTRFVGAILVVTVVVVLANVWGVFDFVQGLFATVRIATVDAEAGLFLTGWDVLIALVWILGTHFVLRNLPGLCEAIIFRRMAAVQAGVRYVILTFMRYGIFIVGYSAALLALHFSFASVGWILAAASVGLGFGLQEIVANFVSGLILLVERPIRVGDVITVGNTGGTVEKINIRATIVTNWDRQQIIVPNKNFITRELTNWTRNDDITRRIVNVGIAYGSDVAGALRLLNRIVDSHPKILADPGPSVIFVGFGESSLDFKARFFTRLADGVATVSEVHRLINERFEAEGSEIPFPQRDLHVRSADADVADALAGVRKRRRKKPPKKEEKPVPLGGDLGGFEGAEPGEGEDGGEQ
ncbi:MAG: mechanosensitive ion channel domain-containing protein [Planctomycetota bacterium]